MSLTSILFLVVCFPPGIVPCGWTIWEGEILLHALSMNFHGRTPDGVWGLWPSDPLHHQVSVLGFLVWWFLGGVRSKPVNCPYFRVDGALPNFHEEVFLVTDDATYCQVCGRLFHHLSWQIIIATLPCKMGAVFHLCRVWGNTCSLDDQFKLKPCFGTCSQ